MKAAHIFLVILALIPKISYAQIREIAEIRFVVEPDGTLSTLHYFTMAADEVPTKISGISVPGGQRCGKAAEEALSIANTLKGKAIEKLRLEHALDSAKRTKDLKEMAALELKIAQIQRDLDFIAKEAEAATKLGPRIMNGLRAGVKVLGRIAFIATVCEVGRAVVLEGTEKGTVTIPSPLAAVRRAVGIPPERDAALPPWSVAPLGTIDVTMPNSPKWLVPIKPVPRPSIAEGQRIRDREAREKKEAEDKQKAQRRAEEIARAAAAKARETAKKKASQ